MRPAVPEHVLEQLEEQLRATAPHRPAQYRLDYIRSVFDAGMLMPISDEMYDAFYEARQVLTAMYDGREGCQ